MMRRIVMEDRAARGWSWATQHATDINNRSPTSTSTSPLSPFRTHGTPASRLTGDPANAAPTRTGGGRDRLTWRRRRGSLSWRRWRTAGWRSTCGASLLASGRGSAGGGGVAEIGDKPRTFSFVFLSDLKGEKDLKLNYPSVSQALSKSYSIFFLLKLKEMSLIFLWWADFNNTWYSSVQRNKEACNHSW